MPKSENNSNNLITAGNYLGLGTQLAATVVIMFFVGKYLDETLNTYPYLIIIFSLFGSCAGIYNFVKTVIHLGNKSKQKNIRR